MTEGMLKMMGVFSELERNIISQRVKSGMANAKAKGKTIGRPATTEDDIPSVFYKHYPKYKKGEINKKEFSRLFFNLPTKIVNSPSVFCCEIHSFRFAWRVISIYKSV